MARPHIFITILFALLLSGCQTPAPFSTNITNFATGVVAVEATNDELGVALANELEKQRSASFLATGSRIRVVNCANIPNPKAAAATLPGCTFVAQGENAQPPLTSEQQGLIDSKKYLELVRNYSSALVSLVGSTDFATASKDTATIGTSIGGIAAAVGNADASAKAAALSTSGAGNAILAVGGAILADWQYEALKSAVDAANDPIQKITTLVVVSFQNAQMQLIVMSNKSLNSGQIHILDPDYTSHIADADYLKQLGVVSQTVDRINLIRSANVIDAAQQLGAAHDKLEQALQGHANITDVTTAVNNFSIAATKAQTVVQQTASPVALFAP